MGSLTAPLLANSYAAEGMVKEVVYLGLYTRYVVTLDVGSELIVVQQNLLTSATDAES